MNIKIYTDDDTRENYFKYKKYQNIKIINKLADDLFAYYDFDETFLVKELEK
jgi:hypothetical protein